ncbi:DUF7520 family protein [Haloarchaeobius sp. DFWS5]|uniref:DUF7520 family protein n=1 Tax=Haloarchaeobius sp. DFWS5 TaxID=3446114 RepID=UPI003EBA5F4C
MSQRFSDRLEGERVVGVIYAGVVVLAGVFGAAVGVLLGGEQAPNANFAGIEFAISPLSMAVYGMVMVGMTLGILLLLVRFVSRYDDAALDD